MRAFVAAVAAGGVFALGLAMTAPGTAWAAQVINFTGDCSDCSGQGVGTLTLTQTPDGPLTKADFLSFAYKSSLLSFSLSNVDIVAVVGSIDPNNLGKSYIDVLQLGGTGWEFTRNADGSWSVSNEITHGEGKMGPGGAAVSFGGWGGGGGDGGDASSSSTLSLGGSVTWSSNDGGDGDRQSDDSGLTSSLTLGSPGVDVTSAVPEPASWALLVLGFAGVGGAIRRGRRAPGGIETA